MKNNIKYFILGAISVTILALFINATVDTNSGYFSYIKNGNPQSTSVDYALKAVKIPAKVVFAGENVPVDDMEVRERLDRELTVNSFWHSNTILMFKRANRFIPTIEKILEEENVPKDFIYLAMAESGFENVSSSAGASGFWQFLKSTGSSYGLAINSEIDERYNVEKATRAACRYLKDAKNKTGSWTAAAAGYNMGTQGVINQQNKQLDVDYYNLLLNSETSRYLQRIIALKLIHQNQIDFGFNLSKDDLYQPFNTKTVEINSSVNWINFAKENGISYKYLRIYNPWIRDAILTNKDKKTYFVKIPA